MARNGEIDDYGGYCKDCKANTYIVLDHSNGDTICTDCGLVLESYYIDETTEWRAFNDDNNDKDPNRVGYNANPLLSQGNLTTSISNNKGDHAIPKWLDGVSNSDRVLLQGRKNLGMKNHAVKAVHEAVDRRMNPKSVLAAIIYTITELSDEKKPLRDISLAADVAKGTIKKSFKDTSPHVSYPLKWWCQATQLTLSCN
ncbi:hypothetical protein D5086_030716 [Populus alba]|uniref:Uncharacterized protein n=1 Tax=Populus alba TaxID=43335 RepID=A0ACC4APC8_POPAL